MQKIYPFKFLDSYQRVDKDFFFGRDDEIEELYQMIFQTRILVLYGTSGTGKTSLIQCGLANKFQIYDWLALYIRRGGNIISSLDKALCDETNEVFSHKEKNEFIIWDLPKKIQAVYKASFRPIYLIFDQFEELYILGTKEEQGQFIKIVKDILAVEQPVKIILSIREEYLGYLYEFEKEVPQLLRKKLRVEPMNLEKVNDVTKGINDYKDSMVKIKTDEIVEFTKEIFERLKGKEKTLTIELPYLQVFLDKLYINKTKDKYHQTEALLSLEDLKNIGDIGDVLQNFLEEQVKKISDESSSDKKVEPETLWKILSEFCTLEGTKKPVSKKELITELKSEINKKVIENAVNTFENERLVKKSEDEELYELAHDSLALKIAEKRSEDDIAKLEVKRIIESKTALKELFTEKQLNFIEPYLNKLEFTDEEKKLIDDSKKAARRKRIRRRVGWFSIGFFIIIGFIIMGIIGQTKLEKTLLNRDIEKIVVKITSANTNFVRVRDLEEKDPTLALQLDKEAMFLMDSVCILKDSLRNKSYGIMSRFRNITDFREKKYNNLDTTYRVKDSLIRAQAESLAEKDYALYKNVPPENPDDAIFDKRFVNGIFPNKNKDSIFKVWYAKEGRLDSIKSHGQIAQVVFPSDSNRAMVLYKNGTVAYWDSLGVYHPIGDTNRITSIAPIKYIKIGYKILSTLNTKKIVEWNLNGTIRKSEVIKENKDKPVIYRKDIQFKDSVVSIAISPSRAKIFTASYKGMGVIWSADTSNVVLDTAKVVFSLNQDTILCSAFSNNGKMIITGSTDHTAKIWNAENGNPIKTLNGHIGPITSVAFSANDSMVYTGSMDKTFRRWKLPPMDSILNSNPLRWNKTLCFDSLFIRNIIDANSSRNPNK